MILIEQDGVRMLVFSLDGHEGASVLAEDIPEPPPYVRAADLNDDGSIPLQLLKDDLWSRVKQVRDGPRLTIAPTTFGAAQADPISSGRIAGLVIDAMEARANGEPFEEIFTLFDNTERPFDAEEMISFGRQVAGHIKLVMKRGREFRKEIRDATSAEELAGIDIEEGWPNAG